MRDQTEIALDQNVFCLKVTLLVFLKILAFFLRRERLLESLQDDTSQGVFFLSYVRGRKIVLFHLDPHIRKKGSHIPAKCVILKKITGG